MRQFGVVSGSEPLRAWHGYTLAIHAQELLGTMAALAMRMVEEGNEEYARAGLSESIEEIKDERRNT